MTKEYEHVPADVPVREGVSGRLSAGSPQRVVWPLGGYAPGNYMCRCRNCGAQFEGDKRAMACLECAVIGAKARFSLTESALSHVTAAEGRLRIALWNELRRAGVPQDRAIEIVRDAADGSASVIETRSAETGTGSVRQDESAAPQADAQETPRDSVA